MIEYRAGAVWECSIDFQDGEGARKKYIVLLSDCDQDGDQAYAALTTSRGDKRYGAGARSLSPCSTTAPCFRIEANQEKCFPADTWVQFNNGGHQSRAGLERLRSEGRATYVHTLSDERLRSLLNCAKKSPDVTKRDNERIDRALKARAPARKPPSPAFKAPAPSAAPAYVSPEILAVRIEIGGFCISCRADIAGLMGYSDAELTAILHGEKVPAKDFVDNAKSGVELFDEQRRTCTECAKTAPQQPSTK